jgi:exonuclease SbcC
MKFLKIKATGFLSHIETEVRLEGYDAVVVVGPNGAGKSSLMVDAVLVALFGQGRSGDLDGYIRNGKDMMTVEFDFALGEEMFRVVRKRSKKTARGSSALEFYQIDSLGNVVRMLTGGSIGETESLIRKTVGTDFDTLVKSSVIEQGEADFFCAASPSERMELFSKIWDLEKYDEFEQMARDVARETKEKIRLLEERSDMSLRRVFEIRENAKQLEGLKKQLDKESSGIIGLEKKKGDLQKKIGAYDAMLREVEKAKAYQAQADKDLKAIGDQHSGILGKIERYTKILKNKEVVYQKAVEEKAISQEIGKIESEVATLIKKADDIRDEEDALRKQNQAKTEKVQSERKVVEREIEEARRRIEETSWEIAALSRKEEQLKQMCLDADKLMGVQCHPDFDPAYVNETCRFIKDAVEAKRKIPEFEKEIGGDKDRNERVFDDANRELTALNEKKRVFDEDIEKIKKQLEGELEQVRERVTAVVRERKEKEALIADKKSSLEDIKRYTKLLPEVSLAEEELPKLIEEEKKLSVRCDEILEEIGRGKSEIEKLRKSLVDRSELEIELQSICKQVEEATAKKDELTKKVGAIETELSQMEALNAQITALTKEAEDLGGKKALYQILEDAFKQVPYMLVARGIGAVENAANEILSTISSSGLRVTIKTEKMTKTTKKVRDEIHLSIEDDDGQKAYKFLSGGEKLRVALALRLAIGEVFAHRRGVSIDSLLADEPFGPLDTEGVEDMKEAFRELRKRFEFIGVITHVEKAMDIFPARLVFEKNSSGGTSVSVGEEYA